MIRFRHREDEERYLRLLSDVYRRVAGHLPPAQVTPVLRGLGKLQDMLWLEGIRQGVAAAAISNAGREIDGDATLESLKAFQLHAHVYGSQDTPLRDVEIEWLEKLGLKDHDHAWLDSEPMRFAPDTEAAFETVHASESMQSSDSSLSTMDVTADVDHDESPESDVRAFMEAMSRSEDEPDTQEQPDALDRVRDELIRMHNAGIKPRDYSDLVLRLHLAMQMDAAWIDMQLGTDMGRTVLAQSGFGDYAPGPFGLNLTEVTEQAERSGD